jgi:hypothetical protein
VGEFCATGSPPAGGAAHPDRPAASAAGAAQNDGTRARGPEVSQP